MNSDHEVRLTAEPTDEDLLRRLLAGDEDSFVALYRRRHGAIYRFALRVSGSKTAAEDVTQEVFMSLMNGGCAQYDRARGSFAAYLYGIARHHLYRRMEQDKGYVSIAADAEIIHSRQPDIAKKEIDPLRNLAREELISSLRQAVATLPIHYREVVVLCDLEELNYADAARVIGCPEGTIRSRLNRARALLLNKLHEAENKRPSGANIRPARCFA